VSIQRRGAIEAPLSGSSMPDVNMRIAAPRHKAMTGFDLG
jgi:hypothetical protein